MTNQNIEDTSPLKLETNAKPKRKLFLKILIGLAIILIGGGIGGYFGYQNAIKIRLDKEASQRIMTATVHWQKALEMQAAKRYDLAKVQIEYVIQIDPNYPGAVAKLTEIMTAMGQAAIPTPVPSAAPSPTPDNRNAEQLFAQAHQYLVDKQWAAAVETLDNLRKISRDFRAIEVDGMYYVGLRYRGMDKIMNGSLEEGIYDFSLTERFGPLDKDANSYRNWSRYYINGASFWGLDWGQVVDAFAQIYPSVPNMRDGSGWTATDRFRIASAKYGEVLAGQGNYCDAEFYFQQAMSLSEDPVVAPTATAIYDLCHPAPTDTPEPEFTEVPTEAVVATTEVSPVVTEASVTPEVPIATEVTPEVTP